MAICTLNEPFKQISGAVGGREGVVCMPDRNGRTLLRDNVVPTFPATDEQYFINNTFSSINTAWAQVGETIKNNWNVAAAGLQETGRLGQLYDISGHALYVRVNMYRLMDGQAITSTVPSTAGSAGVDSLLLQVDGTELYVTPTRSVAPAAGFYYVKVSATNLTPTRDARQNELRAVAATQALSIVPIVTTGSTQDMVFTAPQYPVSAGNRRGVGIIQLNSDYFPVNGIFVRNIAATNI